MPEVGETITIHATGTVDHISTGHGRSYKVRLPLRDYAGDTRTVWLDPDEILPTNYLMEMELARLRQREKDLIALLDPDRPNFLQAIEALRKRAKHYECEDCWYSCALLTCDDTRDHTKCDCGAQQAIDALAALGLEP